MGGITFLPFVRESKLAPVAEKSAKVTAAPAAATKSTGDSAKSGPAPVAQSATATAAAGTVDDLANAITAKGDEIRALKANNVSG